MVQHLFSLVRSEQAEIGTLVLIFVIFLIAHPSPDRRWRAATTQPYAPWPSSLTNWYSPSTMKVLLSAVKVCREIGWRLIAESILKLGIRFEGSDGVQISPAKGG
jgi:hypothetical protein